jgi:hypothetical protein
VDDEQAAEVDLGGLTPVPDARVDLRLLLRRMHLHSAGQDIDPPDDAGAFGSTRFLRTVRPVVIDANVLRNDLLPACRHNRRSVLINAAKAAIS